jgi:hypothetical protein
VSNERCLPDGDVGMGTRVAHPYVFSKGGDGPVWFGAQPLPSAVKPGHCGALIGTNEFVPSPVAVCAADAGLLAHFRDCCVFTKQQVPPLRFSSPSGDEKAPVG